MNPAEATREVFWNITHIWVMYALLVPTALIAGFGLWRRARLWRAGRPAARFDRVGERLALVAKHVLAQRRTAQETYAGAFHLMLYSGFVILTIATLVVMVHEDFKLRIMQGAFYLYFQSFLVDIFGALVVVGVALAGWRRWARRPKPLVYTEEASIILVAIFVIAVTGFLLEGWRIGATDDPWGHWSPVGFLVAKASKPLMSVEAMETAHLGLWWFHLVAAFAFLAWAPYTKMLHVVTAPLNVYTANLDGYGASLKRIDFETAQSFGVNALSDLTWKDLLDLDACTECGRCTAVCPAATVGKELSPRDIILDLRELMHRSEEALLAAGAAAAAASGNGEGAPGAVAAGGQGGGQTPPEVPKIAIIDEGSAVSPTALWQCTTCAACMEACPVYIEQMPKIVDARRFLVMEQAEFPDSLQAVVTSLEQRSHPFPGTSYSRVSWTEGLGVKVLGELEDPAAAEVLLWVGCGGALVERNQKSTRALAQLMTEAGVKFAILGREEACTGDPARRIGNEFLFEMLAKGNVETLDRYGVKKIVTSCPHCFNTFANEYPHLGGHYEVMHHSQMLSGLVAEGKLAPQANGQQVTFHDPCYLGRHNGIFDQPRELVRLTTRSAPIEMKRSREQSFCCGGGGGMCYVDEKPDQRVNQERADEAIATGADVVAVGCPFCATMLEDGVAARKGERDVVVRDVAELLWESVSAGKR
ncbi:MAG TPA: heterodisulfide reductase-related iron-sulfur binding cluster, partial [Thermoanaerobaculia bacterium]|nr:heterodisulfide reductase-related iron-sulfur binding cluster [Thermoanaerobaculia bacterium]